MTKLNIKKYTQEKRKEKIVKEYETSVENINAWNMNTFIIYSKEKITKINLKKKILIINKQKNKKYVEKNKNNFCIVLKCYDYYYDNCNIEESEEYTKKLKLFINLLENDNDDNYYYNIDLYKF